MTGARGPQSNPDAPNSREKSRGARKTSSTAYKDAQLQHWTVSLPDPPAWLDADQLAIWNSTAPKLFKANIVHEVDSDMLGAYCVALEEWVRCKAMLKKGKVGKRNLTDAEKKGLADQAAKAFLEAKALGDGFGMNHQARTRQGIKMKGGEGGQGGDAGSAKEDKKKKILYGVG